MPELRCAATLLSLLGFVIAPATQADADAAALHALAAATPAARATTLTQLEQDAAAGRAAAARRLAAVCYHGSGVPRDINAALAWWQRAAALGDRDAAYNSALLLHQRGAVSAAIAVYNTPPAADDTHANFLLGSALSERARDAEDLRAARHHLTLAADQGYAPAQYNLALLLLDRFATAETQRAAQTWLDAASPALPPARILRATLADDTAAANAPPAAKSAGRADQVQDHRWVLAQPPHHYTLMVAAGGSKSAIRQLLEAHPAGTVAAWFMHRPRAAEPYSAVVGSYTNYGEAQAALAGLPVAFRRNAPWIRRFGTLQNELRALLSAGSASPVSAAPPSP